jgi:hypothetical protein
MGFRRGRTPWARAVYVSHASIVRQIDLRQFSKSGRSYDWAAETLYLEGGSDRLTDLVQNNKGARVYIRNYDICRML